MFMPMFKTALFLVIIWCCYFYRSHGCLEKERTHLLQIVDSINYPHGSSLYEDWIGKDCCNWFGIECNSSSSRVISIDLSFIRDERFGLWYPNASLFAAFKELEILDLRRNHIGGWVAPQAFSEMQSLRKLYLWNNNLSASIDSLRGLCELKNLRLLYLDRNNLDGRALPPCLSNLSMLEDLSLSDNDLGSYSSALTGLCKLKNLRYLDLGRSNLNGRALPPCLSNLSTLETLLLYDNDLGAYSSALTGLCGLSTLKSLYLGGNHFDDDSFLMCMGNFSLLEDLDLSGNNLSGHFGNSISGLKRLKILDLGSNHLKDDGISPWIYNLTSLTYLYLENNTMKGSDNMRGLCGLSALTTLHLYDNYLSSLPICMGNFSLLEDLDVSTNNLSSLFVNSIPGLKQLQELYLESNQLTDEDISPWISNLTSLIVLYLGSNKFKGSDAMRGICKLRNLEELDTEENSFECNIHPCFGNMHHLSFLNLPRNQFKGSIPPSIFGNLTMLEFISIAQNQFSGVISFSVFANLSKLSYVDLSENAQLEVETECPKWFPTFQLYHLLLNNWILNKRSNNHIPSFISTQHMLKTLNLGYTFLQGTIPSWLLYNATIEYLNLRGNSLEGSFLKSTDHNKSMLYELDISDNNIFGELPSNMDTLFPNLVLLNMSTNKLQGVIPLSVSKLQNLITLDLSQNNLSGEMPQLLTRNNTSLKFLKLSNNKLQGDILSKYSNLTELVVLLLDNNEFTGTITSIILTSPSLIILDLRENHLFGFIPSWLPSLPNLALLLLGRNLFDGSIPTELCQLQNLHILDLSYNKISGTIPSCLGNISSWMKEIPIQIDKSLGPQFQNIMDTGNYSSVDMPYTRIKTNLTIKGTMLTYEGIPFSLITGIDLSMNQLIDSIPFQMGNLKELRFLNLSHNILSGPFPESFKNLENIESLDLSHNKLVGMIPPQIVQLHSISTFSVAFNNLSGPIPFEKQFSTFKESSYADNHDLCGKPLQRNCSSNNRSQTQDGKGEEEDNSGILDHPMFFYLLVTISYALGFWSFIALICNKNRRQKLFRIVDRYYD
ncbi:LRR receptor-like serine/threonine-protein kinase GSO1 isoform X3 [Cinnamomum micranthum f. kanehirae]|uniref:LRR receptor-like serine/threonine-protein kinase GSO1 isoform X3 n=1 Tax=Cinnamomum micranthum f. kanehirae TaxID=337451 RepID=A0A3S3N6C0_9MAGN|nr:LRR receptor-like serine/threonine-protein kinase GSO1 isoform X3 [Cinnamomum micranthum f. kanehirae]